MADPTHEASLSDGVIELRLIDKRDLEMIKRAAHNPDIRRRFALLKARPDEYFERYRELWRNGDGAAFTISAVGGDPLGLTTVERREAGRVELGLWLLPEARGGGHATRGLRLASRWAVGQPGVERLEVATAPEDKVAQGLAERAGFRREGILRSYHVVDGRREDAMFFSLLPDELDEPPGASSSP